MNYLEIDISLGILKFQPYGFWDRLSGSFIVYTPDTSKEILRKSELKFHYFLWPCRFFFSINLVREFPYLPNLEGCKDCNKKNLAMIKTAAC
jgi:hypothetical protein